MTNQFKKVTVTVSSDVERILRGLALFNDRASLDSIVAKAIRTAGKDREFQDWMNTNGSLLDASPETTASKKRGPRRVAAA